MNDETREQLSAYLDGALPEAERREVDARLAASAELRGALEDLRAVSRAVKDLPQVPLPDGFITRFQARRARGDAPRENWVFLPPQARPVVAALSFGVVALMIWDKATRPPEDPFLHAPGAAKVYEANNAPVAQLDLSRRAARAMAKDEASISGAGASASGGGELGAGKFGALSDAKSLDIEGAAQAKPRAADKLAYLQGEAGGSSAQSLPETRQNLAAVRGGARARAAGSPIAQDALQAPGSAAPAEAEPQLTDRTRLAMTEEERSARNEEMFGQLESQKKKMGMKVLPKGDSENKDNFLGLRERPAAPALRAPIPGLLKSAKASGSVAAAPAAAVASEAPAGGPGRLAPDAGLVFADAGSLASSWVLLGLPGDAPDADFSSGRIVIIKPSATKILSVTAGRDAVTVVFRSLLQDEKSDPARDRVATLPASPKTVLIYDASPR